MVILSVATTRASIAQESAGNRCPLVDLGPADTASTASAPTRTEGIYALLHAWRAAVRTADIPRVISLVTEDAEFWTHGAAPVIGRAALADAFRPFFIDYDLLQDFECRELVVRGDLAFLRGLERNHLIPRAGGDTVEVRQRAFSILRRSADGQWRFARGMTNQSPDPER